jgi:hypothetical protein
MAIGSVSCRVRPKANIVILDTRCSITVPIRKDIQMIHTLFLFVLLGAASFLVRKVPLARYRLRKIRVLI